MNKKIFLIAIIAYSNYACARSLTDQQKKDLYNQIVKLYDEKMISPLNTYQLDDTYQLDEFFKTKNISKEDAITILNEQSKIVFDKIVFYNRLIGLMNSEQAMLATAIYPIAITLGSDANKTSYSVLDWLTLLPWVVIPPTLFFSIYMANKYKKELNIIERLINIINLSQL